MSTEGDDFDVKMRDVLIGRSTRGMSSSHNAHQSKHAAHLTANDTNWVSMTSAEKLRWTNLFDALSITGVRSRITLGADEGFPKKIYINSSMVSDLKTRYT